MVIGDEHANHDAITLPTRMNGTTIPPDAARADAELVRLLYRQVPASFVLNYVVAALTTWGLWSPADAGVLTLWCIVMFGYTALRAATLWVVWRRSAGRDEAMPRCARVYTATSVVSGLIWGSLALRFIPGGSSEQVVLVTLLLCGITAGSLASLSPYLPVYWAHTGVTTAPLVGTFLLRDEPIYLSMATACMVYIVAMFVLSRTINNSLRESVALRFQNLALIGQLTAEKEKAEEAYRAKSQFLAAASHDLRQPAHALRLFVSSLGALAEKGVPIEASRLGAIVRKMQASLGGQSRLLNGLLDISRLDAGVVKPELRSVPLQRVFEAMRASFAEQARQRNLALRIRATGLWVSTDRVLLEQILANLISNAVRYTSAGGILLAARRRGARAELQVWDTGSGIPEDQREAIFREYYQIGNPQRDLEKGLGIGLSIVRRAAELLGAEVRLRSRPGRGSVFSLQVPVVVPVVVPKDEAPAPVSPAPGISVLALDDDHAVLDALDELLGAWGHRLLAASRAADAIALARSESVQLVIADYRLAEPITGAEALRQILSVCPPATLGAIITGDTSPERIREAVASGYTILHKPIEPSALRKLIDSAVAVTSLTPDTTNAV
jgi:signal transduction histidine kinase/ActR/RegA family two-component response regulator